jgi:hypothetical protein
VLQRALLERRLRVFVETASGDEYRFRAGVGKYEIYLVYCLCRVNRNVDGAQAQDGEVGNRPFGSILGKQRDPVARTHAETRKAERSVLDSFDESLCGGADPFAVCPVIQSVGFLVTQNGGKDQAGN